MVLSVFIFLRTFCLVDLDYFVFSYLYLFFFFFFFLPLMWTRWSSPHLSP